MIRAANSSLETWVRILSHDGDEAGERIKDRSRDGLTGKYRGNCLLLANESYLLKKRKEKRKRGSGRSDGCSRHRNMISGDRSLRITDPNRRRGHTSAKEALKYSWSLALLFVSTAVFLSAMATHTFVPRCLSYVRGNRVAARIFSAPMSF